MATTWKILWNQTKRLALLGMVFLSLCLVGAPRLWARSAGGHHDGHGGHGGHGGGYHGGGSHSGGSHHGVHGRGGTHSGVAHGGRSHRRGIHMSGSHRRGTHIGSVHGERFHGGTHHRGGYHGNGIHGTGHVGGGHTYIAQYDHHGSHHYHHDYHDYHDYFHYPHFDYHYYPSYFGYSSYFPFYSYGTYNDYVYPGPLVYAPDRIEPATGEYRDRLEGPPTVDSYQDRGTAPNSGDRGETLDGVVIRRPFVEAVEAPEALPSKPEDAHRSELEKKESDGESPKSSEGE